MKHARAVLAVDLVQIAILQGLVNERVSKIDANKQEFATKVIEREDAIEAALLKLRDTQCRVTARQFLA